ncbi:molybdopterin molybdotransferase MoeA [Flagellimonas meridianipacifica]|uniref:Molybdopterin molybdenumtransferase n=1 Tax=Flagellimonas meridianipacifica TaxID=1080225 RepID=A0A2T0MBY7_9FLAO|nr:molybdopterin molybdotransferase MoeA [Allomuricauda pacifica]PRX55000.1 molybdopterin molybdotransferase [Allomuricauda pacifica]
MISFDLALEFVLKHEQNFGTETVPFSEAYNRVLAESVLADRDFPPFNRSTRDGIAVSSKALSEGMKQFKIVGIAQAGAPQLNLENHTDCVEIMTGAMVPKNADTVIMYEHLERVGDTFQLLEKVKPGQNIHYQASDFEKGATLLKPGVKITAAEIGVLASVGKHEVLVKVNPKVAVVSTGDELVDVDKEPLPFQIRKSNSYSVQGLLKKEGMTADVFHLVDDKEILEKKLAEQIEKKDVLILSGGVSKGKYDYLPEILNKLGVQKEFHRVLQRPGKPFWFGIHHIHKTFIFAFPGNPVSTFVNYHVYFKPWLNKTLGAKNPVFTVLLKESMENSTDLTFFKGVQVAFENGSLVAEEVKTTGSGDVIGLTNIDGFVQLSPKDVMKEGAKAPFIPTRSLT